MDVPGLQTEVRRLRLDRWRGTVGHNWGTEHADSWVWLHAAGFRLVDMPGYGYASAPKAKVASWTALIHKFLQGRSNLARAF